MSIYPRLRSITPYPQQVGFWVADLAANHGSVYQSYQHGWNSETHLDWVVPPSQISSELNEGLTTGSTSLQMSKILVLTGI